MPRYLNSPSDLTFKHVFRDHKHLCMSLLNSIYPLDDSVAGMEYLLVKLAPEVSGKKNFIADIRCANPIGRRLLEKKLKEKVAALQKEKAVRKAIEAKIVELLGKS